MYQKAFYKFSVAYANYKLTCISGLPHLPAEYAIYPLQVFDAPRGEDEVITTTPKANKPHTQRKGMECMFFSMSVNRQFSLMYKNVT